MILLSINETTTSEGFQSISEESLLRILNHPHLNISCQNHLQKALETWCVVNIDEERRQERLKHLKKAISSHDKFLPVVPCVVGYTYENDFLDGEMDFEKFNYLVPRLHVLTWARLEYNNPVIARPYNLPPGRQAGGRLPPAQPPQPSLHRRPDASSVSENSASTCTT